MFAFPANQRARRREKRHERRILAMERRRERKGFSALSDEYISPAQWRSTWRRMAWKLVLTWGVILSAVLVGMCVTGNGIAARSLLER